MLYLIDQKLEFRKIKRLPKLRCNNRSIILLTGSIASGKTLALNLFKRNGFATFNTDAVARDLISYDKNIQRLIKDAFHEQIVNDDQSINRNKLSDLIFSNQLEKAKLETILYKPIRITRSNFIETIRNKSNRSIVIEIPLLFEKVMEMPDQFLHLFQYTNNCFIISTYATLGLQYSRAMQRKNMTKEKFHDIIAMQSSNYYRFKHSDYIINNSGSILSTKKSIRKIIYRGQFKRGRA